MTEPENVKPEIILVDIYGKQPVPAATFDQGVTADNIAGIEQATYAQKHVVPGAYSER